MLSWEDRIRNYNRVSGFPLSLFIAGDGRVVGTFILGNNYQVKSSYYGGYPNTYLRRVKALFPDKQRALHLFSGKVDLQILPGDTVDCNAELSPTYRDDAQQLLQVPLEDYDWVLIDPPYSAEDAEHYGTTMVSRRRVMQALVRCRPDTHLVWLDQVLPMWRKDEFALEAIVGVVRSSNHRFRVMSIFRRL